MRQPINYNQTELLARGWTMRRIKVFWGEPDFMAQGRAPHFRNSVTPKLASSSWLSGKNVGDLDVANQHVLNIGLLRSTS